MLNFAFHFFVCYGLSVYCLSLSLRGFPHLLLWRLPLLIFNKLLYPAPTHIKQKQRKKKTKQKLKNQLSENRTKSQKKSVALSLTK
jgi:hypothetical protein